MSAPHPGTDKSGSRTCDAEVSNRIVRNKFNHLIEIFALVGFLWIQFPEPVKPGELKQLLWKEEAGNEEGLNSSGSAQGHGTGHGRTCGEKKLKFCL